MPWLRFVEDFDYRPVKRRVTYGYLAGRAYRVTRECARQAAEDRSAAFVIPTPATREEANRVRQSIETNPVRQEIAHGLDTAAPG